MRQRKAGWTAVGVGAVVWVILVIAYSARTTRFAALTLTEDGAGGRCVAKVTEPLAVVSHDYVAWTLVNHCKDQRRMEVKFDPRANPMNAGCKLWMDVPDGRSISLGRCEVTEEVRAGDLRNRRYDLLGGDEQGHPTLEIHGPDPFLVWLSHKVGL